MSKCKLLSACAIVCLSLGVSVGVHGQASPSLLNLFAGRGDFEGDWSLDGVADKWTATFDKTVFTPSITSSTFYTGKRCQMIVVNKNNANAYAMNLIADMSTANRVLAPGSRLTVSFQYKTSSTVSNLSMKVYQNWTRADGTGGYRESQGLTAIAASTSWTKWQKEMAVPSDATSFQIGIYLYAKTGAASGTIYIDDFRATDGRIVPIPVNKPIRMTSLYDPMGTNRNDWMMTMQYLDGAAWHAWQDSEATDLLKPGFDGFNFVHAGYISNDYSISPDNPIPYSWILANHPEWFMKDLSGNVISYKGQTSMDVCNTAYQDMFAQKLTEMAVAGNFKALYLDYFDIHVKDNMLNLITPQGYTDAQWQAGVTQFLTKLQNIRGMGIKLYANVAHAYLDAEPGLTWLGLLDGYSMEWGFVMQDTQGNKVVSDWQSWKNKFTTLNYNTTKTLMIGHNLPETWVAERRYCLASYLCCMRPNTEIAFTRNFATPYWLPEFAAPIGTATGSYVVLQGNMTTGALISRAFTNGLVVVNPTDATTYTWNCPAGYSDLDGVAVAAGNKTLAPKSAVILVKAPNIRLTMSATPATPAPGDIVTYTVNYSNVGTSIAQSAYISVPLPPYTKFYSAANGGVYDSVTNKVVWTLIQVPAGGSGSVSFKVTVNK